MLPERTQRLLARELIAAVGHDKLRSMKSDIAAESGAGGKIVKSEFAGALAKSNFEEASVWAKTLNPKSHQRAALLGALVAAKSPGDALWTSDIHSLPESLWTEPIGSLIQSGNLTDLVEWLSANGQSHVEWEKWARSALEMAGDPKVAWETASRHGWLEGNTFLERSLSGWLGSQAPQMLGSLILEQTDDGRAMEMVKGGIEGLARVAPDEALRVLNGRPSLATPSTMEKLIRSLSDPKPALSMLSQLDSSHTPAFSGARAAYLTRLSESSPEQAAHVLGEWFADSGPPGDQIHARLEAIRSIVDRWHSAGGSGETIAAWAQELPQWDRAAALDTLVAQFAREDPVQAVTFAMAIDVKDTRLSALGAIANCIPNWREVFAARNIADEDLTVIKSLREHLDVSSLVSDHYY